MKSITLIFFLMCLCADPLAAPQRRHGLPIPPEAADKSMTAPDTKPSTLKRQLDRVQIESEARELLELSQSLQPDIQSIDRGMLPKDTIAKLKRIEKTAKHLRGELGY